MKKLKRLVPEIREFRFQIKYSLKSTNRRLRGGVLDGIRHIMIHPLAEPERRLVRASFQQELE